MGYHDKNYDGVVLRLPTWFIEMNGLDTLIEIMSESLNEAQFSVYHPDHAKNLYELEHYKSKAEDLKEAQQKAKQQQQEADEQNRKILAGEMYMLEWESRTGLIGYDYLELAGKHFPAGECLTKSGVKAEIQTLFKENIKTLEDLQTFANKNSISTLSLDLPGCTDELIDLNSLTLYRSQQGWGELIGISYKRLYVKHSFRQVRSGNIQHRSTPLINLDGVYGINYMNNSKLEDSLLDANFKKHGMYLKK